MPSFKKSQPKPILKSAAKCINSILLKIHLKCGVENWKFSIKFMWMNSCRDKLMTCNWKQIFYLCHNSLDLFPHFLVTIYSTNNFLVENFRVWNYFIMIYLIRNNNKILILTRKMLTSALISYSNKFIVKKYELLYEKKI